MGKWWRRQVLVFTKGGFIESWKQFYIYRHRNSALLIPDESFLKILKIGYWFQEYVDLLAEVTGLVSRKDQHTSRLSSFSIGKYLGGALPIFPELSDFLFSFD